MHEKIQSLQFQLDITDVIYILHRKHRQQNATDNKLGSKPEYPVALCGIQTFQRPWGATEVLYAKFNYIYVHYVCYYYVKFSCCMSETILF